MLKKVIKLAAEADTFLAKRTLRSTGRNDLVAGEDAFLLE